MKENNKPQLLFTIQDLLMAYTAGRRDAVFNMETAEIIYSNYKAAGTIKENKKQKTEEL